MKRIMGTMSGLAVAVAALLLLSACSTGAKTASAPSGAAASAEPTRSATVSKRPSVTLGKDTIFLHVTRHYDPAKYPLAAMTGEPSAIAEFQPAKADAEGKIPRIHPKSDAKTFKFLVMMSTIIPPQDYYLFTKDELNRAVSGTGYKFAELLDGGHSKILPNLYSGYYDFAYVPLNVMTEYWSGNESMNQELWREGNDYVIVGAAYNGGVSLIATPSVTSLSQLAGSRVGIMNPSFNQEALLNKALTRIGLATRSAGGDVAIEMGTPGFVMNDLMSGDVKATIAWASYEQQLRKVFHYKDVVKWSDMGYGTKVPYMVLVVRRDILAKHPDLVQTVVQLNYDATKRALAATDYRADIFKRTDYFKSHYMGMTVRSNQLDPALTLLDAEASPVFLKDVYDYMAKCGYFKVAYPYGQLVDQSFYGKVKK